MAPARLATKNLRPLQTEDDGESDLESDNEEINAESASDGEDDSDQDIGTDEDSVSEDGSDQDVQQRISNVSFGALKQAQDTLSKKRKRGSDTNADHEEKLEALRARLRDIKESKKKDASRKEDKSRLKTETARNSGQKAQSSSDENSDSDSDSAPSEEDATSRARSSKHAPTALSSKYQVTRRRTVVDVPKRVTRDPRFDALQNSSTNPDKAEKAYSFLLDYQKDEITQLRTALKATRNEEHKETLRRKIGSMENRLRAKEAKQREQDILRRHRKEEREKVEQGKTPFYLKRKDVKEAALVEKFKGMKGKERDRLMERRRLKESQRERRMMPQDRRLAG